MRGIAGLRRASSSDVTITEAWCLCRGTCTTEADLSFEDGAGNAMTGTIDCEDTTAGDSPTAITAGGALVAQEGLVFDVDNAVSPETDSYLVCWRYYAH